MLEIYLIDNQHSDLDAPQHMCTGCTFDVLGVSATAAATEFQLAAAGADCDFCGRSRL